jgi:hypothetical protein
LTRAALGLAASVALFLAAGYAWWNRRSLPLYHIDEHYVWLRGVSPEFLSRLPDWPFPPA